MVIGTDKLSTITYQQSINHEIIVYPLRYPQIAMTHHPLRPIVTPPNQYFLGSSFSPLDTRVEII